MYSYRQSEAATFKLAMSCRCIDTVRQQHRKPSWSWCRIVDTACEAQGFCFVASSCYQWQGIASMQKNWILHNFFVWCNCSYPMCLGYTQIFFYNSDRDDRINVFLCLLSLTLGCRVSYQHQHLSVINFDTCLTEWWLHILSAFASVFDMKNLHHKASCMTVMATKCSLCWLNHSLWRFVSVDKLQTTGPAHAWADTFSFFSCRLMAMVTEYQRDTGICLAHKDIVSVIPHSSVICKCRFCFQNHRKTKTDAVMFDTLRWLLSGIGKVEGFLLCCYLTCAVSCFVIIHIISRHHIWCTQVIISVCNPWCCNKIRCAVCSVSLSVIGLRTGLLDFLSGKLSL